MNGTELTSVHGDELLVSKQVCEVLPQLIKQIMIDCPGGVVKNRGLLVQCLENLRVAMALIQGGKASQEVQVLLAFIVPHVDTCNTESNHQIGGNINAPYLIFLHLTKE